LRASDALLIVLGATVLIGSQVLAIAKYPRVSSPLPSPLMARRSMTGRAVPIALVAPERQRIWLSTHACNDPRIGIDMRRLTDSTVAAQVTR
jgi:hypothetical protein